MSARQGQGNTLGVAIVIAVVLVALLALAATRLRIPKKTTETKPQNSAATAVVVKRVESDSTLHQEVELYDPKPLFLPTAINSSDPALPSVLHREPGNMFRSIAPRFNFPEYEMKVVLPEPIAVPANPGQAARVGETPVPFYGLGYVNYPFTPLNPRLAFLEVVQVGTGKVVLSSPLKLKSGENFPAAEWKPLEMMVAVEASGLVGEPAITSGSESEEIDNFFRTLVTRDFCLGARLAPGFYALRIGP